MFTLNAIKQSVPMIGAGLGGAPQAGADAPRQTTPCPSMTGQSSFLESVAGSVGGLTGGLSLAILANAFSVYFITQEQYVYYWDWSGYWMKCLEISAYLVERPIAALAYVITSVRHDQYNPLAVLALTPIGILLGSSRLAYILALTNLYLLPAAVIISQLAMRILRLRPPGGLLSPLVLATASVLMLHPLWAPVLRGLPDVVGFAVIGSILLLHFSKPLQDQRLFHLVATGLLLCFLVLLRRWYLFWVLAFFIVLAPAHGLDIYQRHGMSWRHFARATRNACIIGLTFTLALFSAATPFAVEAVTTNYSDIYSAYQNNSSLLEAAGRLLSYFGWTLVICGLSGLGWLVMHRETRFAGGFLILQSVVTFVLFARTQDFGPQHYYLLMPGIAVGIAVVVTGLSVQVTKPYWRATLIGLLFAVLLASSSIVFTPIAANLSGALSSFVPKVRLYPLVRNDIHVLDQLLDRLDGLELQRRGKVYVLASSAILNSSILQNRCWLTARRRSFCERILTSNDVDKRDGFPRQFLEASYLVVADPTQYHLRTDDQRVVGVLARAVMEGNGIGKSFRRLSEKFNLDDGVTVYVHVKVRPFESADLEALTDEFVRHYPERRAIFSLTR